MEHLREVASAAGLEEKFPKVADKDRVSCYRCNRTERECQCRNSCTAESEGP
jgi:hypothetical protein